jgi:cytosine/adenosine deaminase-related metal-dependent hydrolase
VRRNWRVTVDGPRIVSVEIESDRRVGDLYIEGSWLLPALANGHDHLKYQWPRRIGGRRFSNSYDWIPLLQAEASSGFLKYLTLDDLYQLGSFNNMFAGVTTVVNHARLPPAVSPETLPIDVGLSFRRELMVDSARNPVVWEHRMGLGAVAESLAAKRAGQPFVVHVAEGVDASTEGEVALLADQGALHSGCVLVHAVNLSRREIGLLAQAGCSVVWCPTSNLYLFERTAPIGELLEAGVNVLLGTDSPCSGGGSLRIEMSVAAALLEQELNCSREDAARQAFLMATSSFGRAFPATGVGTIARGYRADLMLLKDPGTGLSDLVASRRAPSLLTTSGRLLIAPRSWSANGFISTGRPSSALLLEDEEVVVAGDPRKLVVDLAEKAGVDLDFFPLARLLMTPAA